jgi:membrane protein
VRAVDQTVAAYDRAVVAVRRRWGTVDHAWAAAERFSDVLATRLAAAISYYGFFAAFALAVVGYSILVRLHGAGTDGFVSEVNDYIAATLPWVVDTAEQVGRGQVTIVGMVVLVLTGVGWVEALRSSQRAIWRLDEHPGNWIIRRAVDLGMLVGLGVLLALSLAMTAAIDAVLDWLAPDTTIGETLLRSVGPVLELAVDIILAAAILAAVARLRLSPRRLIPPALVVAVGIFLLNTAGRWIIARTESRPAYQFVAGTVGLLLYLYLLNQLILFGAALAATARRGTAVDLAAGPAPSEAPAEAPPETSPEGPPGAARDDGKDGAPPVGEPRRAEPPEPR